MKTDRSIARRIAREFRAGRGRAWPWINDKDTIIDAEVMDCVRAAWAADADKPVSPTDLIELRRAIVEELAKKGFHL